MPTKLRKQNIYLFILLANLSKEKMWAVSEFIKRFASLQELGIFSWGWNFTCTFAGPKSYTESVFDWFLSCGISYSWGQLFVLAFSWCSKVPTNILKNN